MKTKDGWQFCARCRQAHSLASCGPEHHEDILHACYGCDQPGGAAEIMRITVECWERATGELLRPSGPTAVFGDRRYGRCETEAEKHRHLEEPWRAVHASVVVALDSARRKSRPSDTSGPLDESRQPKLWSTAKIIAVARRELNKIVVMRHNEARRTSEMKKIKELWIDTGIARWPRGVPRSNVFNDWNQDHSSAPDGPVLCFATDGSGLKDGRAGYAYVARILNSGDDPATTLPPSYTPLAEEYGPVITNPRQDGYIGAHQGD